MPGSFTRSLSNARRRWVVRLLACLVCAQAIGGSVLTTLGPAHVHQAAPQTTGLEAFDFRRAPAQASARPVHVLAAFGHFHGSDTPQRHHHRNDDGSVVAVDGAALQPGDECDDTGLSAELALALPPSLPAWTAASGRTAPLPSAAWPSLTHDPEPLERPPRSV